jgi:two-component system sensor histidine kinase/response regulator
MSFAMNDKPLILVVEDNPANLYLAVAMLKKEEYEIAVAKNGIEAINAVKNVTPDIILLDIMMPEMDGYEVCDKLKENPVTKDIPIIFLTALKKNESLVKGFQCGAVDYITKPFNKEELLLRVKNHLDLKFPKTK